MIISVANSKGGVGKTTISQLLAVHYSKISPTILIDADKQGSSYYWSQLNDNHNLKTISWAKNDLHTSPEIKELASNIDNIIIDCPPQNESIILSSLYISDLVIIPIIPSAFDLWATDTIIQLVNKAKEINPKLVAHFCISMSRGTKMEESLFDHINTNLSIPLRGRLPLRVGIPTYASCGQSALDSNDSRLRFQVKHFIQEVTNV